MTDFSDHVMVHNSFDEDCVPGWMSCTSLGECEVGHVGVSIGDADAVSGAPSCRSIFRHI